MGGRYKAYSEYKDSGVEWLGRVPSHWHPLRFKHALIEKGKRSNKELEAGSISFGRVIYKSAENLSEETKSSYQELLAGEFLVNPLNLNYDLMSFRTALSSLSVVVSTGYIVLQSAERLHKPYVRWLLHEFDVSHMKTLGAGVRQTISFADIGNSFFLEPCREEQVGIATFLDHETAKIDTLIEKQQQLIQLLKEKRQAVISRVVTKGLNPNAKMRDSGVKWLGEVPEHWIVSKAKYVANIFVPQRNKPELNEDSGTAWITMEDMRTIRISGSGKYVSSESGKLAGSKVLRSGAVISSCVGNFGSAAINDVDVIINQQLQAFVPFAISANYLREIVSLSKSYFELIGTAATLIYVNQQGFEDMPVLIPPPGEQDHIAAAASEAGTQIDKLIQLAETAMALLGERRTALISAAVTGKIDVRDWVPPTTDHRSEEAA